MRNIVSITYTESSFCPLLSTPSFQAYDNLDSLDTSPLSVYLFYKNGEIKLTSPTLPKQSELFMVSTFWCQLLGRLFYWGRLTAFKQENIIVETVSTNIFPTCHTYFYVNRHKNSHWIIYLLEWWRVSKLIHNEAVMSSLYLWFSTGTIIPKVPKVPMLLIKIYIQVQKHLIINYIKYVDYEAWPIIQQILNLPHPSNIPCDKYSNKNIDVQKFLYVWYAKSNDSPI